MTSGNNNRRMAQAAEKCRGRLLVAALLLIALAAPASAADTDWFYIGSTNNEDDYYYRIFSTEDQGNYITGWLKRVIGNTTAATLQYAFGKTPSYAMEMWGVNKNETRKQARVFQIVFYDKNDNVITIRTPENDPSMRQFGQWLDCPPGSFMEEGVWQMLNMDAVANQILREYGIE